MKGSSNSSKGKRGTQCISVPLQADRNERAIFSVIEDIIDPKL